MQRRGKKNRAPVLSERALAARLDHSIPLDTEQWQKVEQSLMRMLEFAPSAMILETASAIASYADDQARRGYQLGQADLESAGLSDIA